MKTRLFFMTFLAALLLGAVSMNAFAYTSGGCTWTVSTEDSETVLTIAPTDGESGELESWSGMTSAPWYGSASKITKVVVEPGVIAQTCIGMFCNFSSCTSMDLSGLNTSNCTNFSFMFFGCTKLTSLDLSGFDTSNATTFSSMFESCSSMTSVDLSSFDTSNATDFSYMFFNCKKLEKLDLSSFSLKSASSVSSMLNSLANVVTIVTPKEYSSVYPTINYEMYDVEGGTVIKKNNSITGENHTLVYRERKRTFKITLPSSGMDTFSYPANITIPDGLTVYTAAYDASKKCVVLTQCTGLTFNGYGVVLQGTAGATYDMTITFSPSTLATVEGNELVPVFKETTLNLEDAEAGSYYYVMNDGKFERVASDGTLVDPFHAYLNCSLAYDAASDGTIDVKIAGEEEAPTENEVGYSFTATIPFIPTDTTSTETQIPCRFNVTAPATDGANGTVQIRADADEDLHVVGEPAIDRNTNGTITIPATISDGTYTYNITALGVKAFAGCNNLCDIIFEGTNLRKIESYAFQNCYNNTYMDLAWDKSNDTLGVLNLPEGVDTIASSAIKNNLYITDIHLPSTLKSIDPSNFSESSMLKRITLGEGNTTYKLVDNVLYSYDMQTIVWMPCYDFTRASFTIPSDVTTIGSYAFAGRRGISYMDWKDGNQFTIDFSEATSLTTIENNAFYGAVVRSFVLPSTVTSIGASAFGNTSYTKLIDLSRTNITAVSTSMFENSRTLEIRLPKTVTRIDTSAFKSCEKLKTLYVFAEDAPAFSGSDFFKSVPSDMTLYVPLASKLSYELSSYWSVYTDKGFVPTVTLLQYSDSLWLGTMYGEADLAVPDGVTAYSVKSAEEGVAVARQLDQTVLPSGGYLISSKEPMDQILFLESNDSGEEVNDNMLDGSMTEQAFAEDGIYYYVLTENAQNETGFFYQNTSEWQDVPELAGKSEGEGVNCEAYRAFLLTGDAVEAEGFTLILNTGETTEISISGAGWCAFSSDYALDFSDVEGVTAYYVSDVADGIANLVEVINPASGTGLILSGNAGTYTIPVAAAGTDYSEENLLVATNAEAVTLAPTGPDNWVYVFGYKSDDFSDVGFYKIYENHEVEQYKSYLKTDANALPSAGVNRISFGIDGATAISEVNTSKVLNGDIYDLQGRKVNKPGKGIYIVNGKKVLF